MYGSAIRSDGGLKQQWVKVVAKGEWNAFVWTRLVVGSLEVSSVRHRRTRFSAGRQAGQQQEQQHGRTAKLLSRRPCRFAAAPGRPAPSMIRAVSVCRARGSLSFPCLTPRSSDKAFNVYFGRSLGETVLF